MNMYIKICSPMYMYIPYMYMDGVAIFQSIYICLYLYLATVCICVTSYYNVYPCISLGLVHVYLSFTIYLYLSLCCIPLFTSVYQSRCLYPLMSITVYIFVSMSTYLCLYLSIIYRLLCRYNKFLFNKRGKQPRLL